MAAVQFTSLCKTFRDFFGRRRVKALDGLSLSVEPGQVFGLLGPNGSGKSTTFKIAVGMLRPDSGQAAIMGHAPGTMAARRATGFLPEESSLLPFLTARETLRLHGALAAWFDVRRLRAHVTVTDESDYAASFVVVETQES